MTDHFSLSANSPDAIDHFMLERYRARYKIALDAWQTVRRLKPENRVKQYSYLMGRRNVLLANIKRLERKIGASSK